MCKRFVFISVDRREFVPERCTCDADDTPFQAAYLPYMIARPTRTLPSWHCSRPQTPKQEDHAQRGALHAMPHELLLSVLERLDEPDVLRLSLASKRLWEIGWPFFQSLFWGRWRGTRLIYEDIRNEDLRNRPLPPVPGLTSREYDDLSTGLTVDEWHKCNDFVLGSFGNSSLMIDCKTAVTLAKLMLARGQEVNPFLELNSMCHDLWWFADGLLKADLDRAQLFFAFDYPNEFFSPGKDWTLRNTTIKAFVRGKKLNAAFHPDKPTNGLRLPFPGFPAALLSQITWSRRECYQNNGDWAGHRFELMTDVEHELSSDRSWTDESAKVIRTLAHDHSLKVFPVEGVKDI